MSKRRKGHFPWLFLLLVILPTILAGVYFYKYASPQYVSEAHFIIQGNAEPQADLLGTLTGIPGAGGSIMDAMVIKDYLLSADFLHDIKPVVNVREHFSDSAIDFYARLPPDATQEDLLEYWQGVAEVEYDLSVGISTIKMTGFNPETSRLLVTSALKRSELLVNELSDILRTDALKLAEQETAASERALAEIRTETTKFREKQDVLDPGAQAGSRIEREEAAGLNMVSKLRVDLSQAEAELAQVSTFMQPQALKVKALQGKVNALRQQIAKEQTVTAKQGKGKSTQVAVQLSKYTELQSKLAFAEQLYRSRLESLERVRIEHLRKHRYLTVTVQANLPDAAIKPDKAAGVLTVFLLSFLFWGIGSLSIATIRDHAGWV